MKIYENKNMKLCKLRKKLCNWLLPSNLKIVNKKEVTVSEYMDEHVKTVNQLQDIFTKEFLESLIEKYPKEDQPTIIESEGKLKFTDDTGKSSQIKVPLLTIIPIPQILKDNINLDKYYKDNFGESKNPPKSLEDIIGVQVKVPALNITPVPGINKDVLKDADLNFKDIKK